MESRGKSSSSRNMATLAVAVAFTLLQLLPVSVDSYPIFGTKRFQQHSAPHQAQFVAAPVQLFAPLQGSYEDGYYADDPSNYLYYAPHDPRYHSYGMPVYHGDYKPPTPYLYAQGPTYRYYEDKETAANPLDDLHEEMLEEDEREREEKQHLMEQQMRQQYGQQRHLQQLGGDYQRQRVPQQQKQSLYYQPVYEQQPQDLDYEGEEADEEDEEEQGNHSSNNGQKQMLLMMDPSYAQQAEANAAFLKDLIAYNRQVSSRSGSASSMNDRKSARGSSQSAAQSPPTMRKDFNGRWSLDYPAEEADEEEVEQMPRDEFDYEAYPLESRKSEDKAVRELEALTHRDKSSSALYPIDLNPERWTGGFSPVNDMERNSEFSSNSNNNYEYDDAGDEWINWDSKRSGGAVKPVSIVAFNDRKPSKLVITKVPENHFVLDGDEETTESAKATSAGVKTEEVSTSTSSSPTATVKVSGGGGQKEEVLMRPAPPVRNPFSAPVMKMLEHQESLKTNKYETHAAVEELDNKKRSSSEERKAPKATVYDTIKQLLDMEEHLKQKHAPSRIQKRFVTNEESLVKQLESLKRMKV